MKNKLWFNFTDFRKNSVGSYRLFIPIQDVFFGEEPHAVHQTHLTVALLSINIDAFTLASTQANHTHTHMHTHTHTHNKAKHRQRRGKPKSSCYELCTDFNNT